MSFDEIIQRCSSDFSFFMSMMVWVSFLLGMAWSAGKEFFSALIKLIWKQWNSSWFSNRKR